MDCQVATGQWKVLENIDTGEGDERLGGERKGAGEHEFQILPRPAYGPLFCVAIKGRTRSTRKQCQEADLDWNIEGFPNRRTYP